MEAKYDIIPRPHYVDHILDIIDKGMMIILVGQRRVGKSFILLQLKDRLSTIYPEANVIYINKEWQRFNAIHHSDQLYEYVNDKFLPEKRNYLLIDEVQDIEDYQIALRSLYSEGKCSIIATGSNSGLFSSEISTKLSGRYIEVPVYPLTFKEFLVFHNLENNEESLLKFLKVGGLPGLSLFDINNENQVNDYLQGVFSTIVVKDIIQRETIRNVAFLENLITFIADNIGKLFSIKKVTNTVKSQGSKVSELLTSSYTSYLKQALLLHSVFRYDIHGKRLFELIQKYYFTDQGLRNYLLGFNIRGSIEKLIENVVYNQLIFSGYKVYVGVLRDTEVDFVAEKSGSRIYVQATYILGGAETIKREFGNLMAIRDNYPKIVVSMDPVSGPLNEYPGIEHIHLREFLMKM